MKLFPYQVEGAEWLSNQRRALLADEMGLGKSAQAITAADEILADSILVVCPAVARENWKREFAKFSRFPRQPVISSYEGIVSAFQTGAPWQKFDLAIIDESHFAKNPEAERTKALLGKNGLVHHVERMWFLSGTPMPNHPGELWPIMFTTGRTTLKYDVFCRRYCKFVPGFRQHLQITGAKAERVEELREKLAPIMLRRTVEDVGMQLPELFFGDVVVEPCPVKLSREQFENATKEELWLRKRLEGLDEFNPKEMRLLEAIARSVSTLRLYNGLQKVDSVAQMVNEELESNQYSKIVIFGVHRAVLQGLHDKLYSDFWPAIINGETSERERQERIDRFQKGKRSRVLLCNIRAAGTAITLTAADQVLFVESEWSPGDNRQATKRCHRIGQTRPVRARFVGIANSIDEKIQRINRRKAQDIRAVLE